MNRVVSMLGPEGFGSYEIDWDAPDLAPCRVHRAAPTTLVPGFVDIHCHGAFGIDFMSATSADMLVLCAKLEAEGYEAFLPTTVTASAADILAAIGRLPEHPLIAGFHLEGPFISPAYPGAQPPEHIVPPPLVASEWDAILEHPRLRVVTLAPELPGALELTTRLMERGVLVGMGHSNATYDDARRGFEFGASHTTHTFNAMRGFHHREVGLAGYALLNDTMKAELIYDRRHVSTPAAKLLLKCKPLTSILAVSDCTMAAGMPPNLEIEMWGLKCVTGKGEVRLAESGSLAGSAITLLDAFRNLADDFGEEIAIHACSLNPRNALGITGPPRVYAELDAKREIVQTHVRG